MPELKDAITAIGVLLSAIIAMLGWYFTHKPSTKRDLDNERRKIITNYLIEAWRTLSDASERTLSSDEKRKVERAISDIQIFGSERQVDLTLKYIDNHAKNGRANVNDLLLDLRKTLRQELKLEPLPDQTMLLRFAPDQSNRRTR